MDGTAWETGGGADPARGRHRVLSVTLGALAAAGLVAEFALRQDAIALGQRVLHDASGGVLTGMQVVPTTLSVCVMSALMLACYVAAKTVAECVWALWREPASAASVAGTLLAYALGVAVVAASMPVMPSLATSAWAGAAMVAVLLLWTCLLRPDVGLRLSLVPLARRAAARDALRASGAGMAGVPTDGGRDSDIARDEGEHEQGEPSDDARDAHDSDDGDQPVAASGNDVQRQVARGD